MKTEFKARPVYLSRKDRISAHFTTCFTALVIYRILEQKLNEKYTCEELIDTIRSMDMLIAPGEGYIPTYTRTDITDALHDAFGFRTDYQITSQKNMRKILNQTKRSKYYHILSNKRNLANGVITRSARFLPSFNCQRQDYNICFSCRQQKNLTFPGLMITCFHHHLVFTALALDHLVYTVTALPSLYARTRT